MHRLSRALSADRPGSASPRVHPADDDGAAAPGGEPPAVAAAGAAAPQPSSPHSAAVAVVVDARGPASPGSAAAATAAPAAAPGGGEGGTIPAVVKKRISFAAPITAGPSASPKLPLVASSGGSATQQGAAPGGGPAPAQRGNGRMSFLGEAAGGGGVGSWASPACCVARVAGYRLCGFPAWQQPLTAVPCPPALDPAFLAAAGLQAGPDAAAPGAERGGSGAPPAACWRAGRAAAGSTAPAP